MTPNDIWYADQQRQEQQEQQEQREQRERRMVLNQRQQQLIVQLLAHIAQQIDTRATEGA